MTSDQIAMFALGLATCYWAGFKFGKAVQFISKLGNSA